MRAVGTHSVVFDAPALDPVDLQRKIDHGPDACELDGLFAVRKVFA